MPGVFCVFPRAGGGALPAADLPRDVHHLVDLLEAAVELVPEGRRLLHHGLRASVLGLCESESESVTFPLCVLVFRT